MSMGIKNSLASLGNINVELTSRCNKKCWMCGRRKVESDYPELVLDYGEMDFALVEKIAAQLPPNVVVQLHNNGEALLYEQFGDAVRLFSRQITNIVTNGKLLVAKADEIIDNLDTMAISVIENDPEADEQFELIEQFLSLKGRHSKPFTLLRFNGDVDRRRYEKFNLTTTSRTIHAAMGSFNYRMSPTIPEIGICLDFLHHMAVDRKGNVSICVRFDPRDLGVIGDANGESLIDIWNSPRRLAWLEEHKQGRRENVPLCSYCHFWGVPTGAGSSPAKVVDSEKIFG